MLIEKFERVNITTKQARDDADVLVEESIIDIDLLVILIGRTQLHQEDIFFKKVGKGNVITQIYSSKSFDKYPLSKKHILFLHAFSGCYTASALFKKGKKNFHKITRISTN